MADYTALINAWNNATQPPTGVTGTALTGLTTANKIIAINGWTVTGTVPSSILTTGDKLINCINYAEFKALTAQQQSNLLALCATPGQLLGGTLNVGVITDGMFLDYFSNHAGPTIAALTALAQAIVQEWWQAASSPGPGGGLTSPVSIADLVKAGGLT